MPVPQDPAAAPGPSAPGPQCRDLHFLQNCRGGVSEFCRNPTLPCVGVVHCLRSGGAGASPGPRRLSVAEAEVLSAGDPDEGSNLRQASSLPLSLAEQTWPAPSLVEAGLTEWIISRFVLTLPAFLSE